MNQSETNHNKTAAEAAWEKLQMKLATEPVNAQWVRWAKQANDNKNEAVHNETISEPAAFTDQSTNSDPIYMLSQTPSEQARKGDPWKGWLKRNRKWLSGTAAAGILAVTVFTSAGNEALAAILNKFRMEQVTVVQEDDIMKIMNGVFSEGQSAAAINKFGSFSRSEGSTNSGEYTLAEAEQLLNRKLIMPSEADLSTIYITPSSEITLSLHVDEVNKALKRLGAKKLLPQSIDNKPVKFILHEGVSVSKQTIIDGREKYYSFMQMKAPSIELDPSIPVEEAMDAVLQFPFLPDYIKDSLKKSGLLDNGNVPLPVIADGTAEKRTIEGVEVVMTKNTYSYHSNSDEEKVENTNYGLTWVKDGQMYTINGDGFIDSDAAFASAKELILQ